MQILKNSGYSTMFRSEILQSGLKGYNKILEDDKSGFKPIYRSKEWWKSAMRMEKKKKMSSWLGAYKSCILSFQPLVTTAIKIASNWKGHEARGPWKLTDKNHWDSREDTWECFSSSRPVPWEQMLRPEMSPKKNVKIWLIVGGTTLGTESPVSYVQQHIWVNLVIICTLVQNLTLPSFILRPNTS